MGWRAERAHLDTCADTRLATSPTPASLEREALVSLLGTIVMKP